jgi:N-acetylneuraminic acid mutarotase
MKRVTVQLQNNLKMRASILAALSLVFVMTDLAAETVVWKKLPSLPIASGNFVAGSANGEVIIAGGITWKNDTKIFCDGIWRFESKTKRWNEASKLPHPLAYAAFGQTERGIFFCGGSDGKSTRAGFYRLNPKLELEKLAEISELRVYSGAATCGSKLFAVAGGSDFADLKTLTNTFFSVDLVSGRTQKLPDFPGGELIVPTMTAMNDQLFVFTGARVDAEGKAMNSDSAFVFSTHDNSWKKIKSYPIPIRGLASCGLDDRHILLAGGYADEFTDAAFIYDTKSDAYFKTTSLPYAAMANFVKAGENIYWLGGEDRMRHRSDLFYAIARKQLLGAAKLPGN